MELKHKDVRVPLLVQLILHCHWLVHIREEGLTNRSVEHRLNATAEYCCWPCPSLYDYSVPSSDGYFQQDNAPYHKAQIISDWFLEHDNVFSILKWPPQSPDLNLIEHIWDAVEWEIRIMDVQPTNLQQLRDAIMLIWTKCFQHLAESMPRRIKAVIFVYM